MPAIACKINGALVNFARFSVQAAQNNQDRLTADIQSANGSYVPAIDDIVTVDDEAGTRIFGGVIKEPTLGGVGDSKVSKSTAISCMSFDELGTRFPVTVSIPSTNLKAAVTTVLGLLNAGLPSSLQVTLSGSQATGPTLPDLAYVDTTPDQIFADIATRSGWLRSINYNRVLRFWQVGDLTAPWFVSDATGNAVNEMTVMFSRVDYYNRIIVRYWYFGNTAYSFFGKTGSGVINNGEQVVVGGKTYVFRTTLTAAAGDVLIGTDPIDNLAAAINLSGGAGSIYSAATTANTTVAAVAISTSALKVQAMTVGASGNSVGCTTTCANADWWWEGHVSTITLKGGIDAGVGNSITVDDLPEQALYGVYAQIVEAANVFTAGDAVALGNAIIATAKIIQKTINYETFLSGLLPGYAQYIQRANRNVNENCLLTQVNSTWIEGKLIRRQATAISGSVFKGDRWRDRYKKWSGGDSGGGASTISAGAISGGGGTSGGGGGGGMSVYFLGGSDIEWVRSSVPTWVDAAAGLTYLIDTVARGSTVGTCYVSLRTRDTSYNVQARLLDVELGIQAGWSITISSATFVPVIFPVYLSAGAHHYRLQLLPSVANKDVNGVGYLV